MSICMFLYTASQSAPCVLRFYTGVCISLTKMLRLIDGKVKLIFSLVNYPRHIVGSLTHVIKQIQTRSQAPIVSGHIYLHTTETGLHFTVLSTCQDCITSCVWYYFYVYVIYIKTTMLASSLSTSPRLLQIKLKNKTQTGKKEKKIKSASF